MYTVSATRCQSKKRLGCEYNIQGRFQSWKYFQNFKYKSRPCYSSETYTE